LNSWVDGRAGHTLDSRDRGLQYGDGLFETMRVRGRAIRFLDYHLERLAEGCGRLAISPPPLKRLRGELARIAAQRSEAILKLIVTRGVGPRGYRPSGHERCTRIITLHALSRAAAVPEPARLRMCRMRLGVNERLGGLKTLNRLECVLARAEWTDARIWDGLMRDTEGHIVGGTMSNVFMRCGASLLTPKVDRCGIAGVMRRWVLEQAGGLELRAGEERLRWQDLKRADEVFMTNAIVGIVPVARIQCGRAQVRLGATETAVQLRRLLELQ
jgi:4-amino-4-deoxychorismate lyase